MKIIDLCLDGNPYLIHHPEACRSQAMYRASDCSKGIDNSHRRRA
jgi:hypothetical protein